MSENKINYEQARFIDGYDNYLLFANGNILNCDKDKWIKHTKRKDGYIQVRLSKNKKIKIFLLHQLIGQAFISNPENKQFIDHINHQKDDNRIINLRWVTKSENEKNKTLYSSNTSCFRGVSYYKKNNSLVAQWYDSILGKQKRKSYSISKYGKEQALRLAVIARYDMEQEHNYLCLQTPEDFFNSDEFKQLIE